MAEVPEGFTVRDAVNTLADHPEQWDSLRGWTRDLFNGLAPEWDTIIGTHHAELLDAALAHVSPPSVAVDLGTGTGVGAGAVAARFPDAWVLGVDIAEAMLRAAVAKPHPVRVAFALSDGARLPLRDGSVDLVVAVNVFLFVEEIARVLAPSGQLAVLYSRGEETPIYLPPEELHDQLRRVGLTEVHTERAALGVFHVAVRPQKTGI